jgi:carnitine-CoA ligase
MRSAATATFQQRWTSSVQQRADQPFLIWQADDEATTAWTYGEFDQLVDEVAATLAGLGVKPGNAVHLALASCPAFVAVWLAVSRLGAWMVPSDPKATTAELVGHISRTRAVVGICSLERRDVYDAMAAELGSAAPAVVALDEHDVTMAALRGSTTSIPPAVVAQPSDRLAVMFTSGTTSAPKGVVLTQANYAFAGDVMAAAAGLDAHDRQLVVLPMFHANAQYYSFASAISVGASVAMVGAFSASRFRLQAAALRATHASLFAAPIRMILARDPGGSVDGLSLRHVWFAQNLTAEQYDTFAGLVGCRPRQLYGMTETLPAVITQRAMATSPDLMGEETIGCAVEVIDPASGGPSVPGVVGDLVVGGVPGVSLFAEYLDDSATTQGAIVSRRDDGFVWFRTGDRAIVEQGGSFRFAGRSGDVLKVAGENVSVVEVEAVVAEHPDVFEVAVVGEPDPVRDEVPVAYVVAHPGATVDVGSVMEWAAQRLAPAKRPRSVYVVAELPRTSVGKIRKFLLTTPVQAPVEASTSDP